MPLLQIIILENEPAFNYFASIPLTLAIYTLPILLALKLIK